MLDHPLPPDVNDCSIPDGEILYRRIHPTKPQLEKTSVAGEYRPASGALKDTEWPLSVDLGSLSTPQQTRDRESTPFHVAAFTAGTARSCTPACRIVRDPLPATPERPANPAHALVFGNHENGSGALAKSQFKHIARTARIVLLNENAPLVVREEQSPGGQSSDAAGH